MSYHATEAYYRAKIKTLEDAATCRESLQVAHAVASERAAVMAWLSREAQAESRHGRGLSEPAWRQFEERAMHLRWLSKQISNGDHNVQAATGIPDQQDRQVGK